MKRKRTKISGLVSHATPEALYMGEVEKLKRKFNKGTITEPELRKYVSFLMLEKRMPQTTTITVKFGGKEMVLTIEEYNKYYKPAYGDI